MRPLRNLGMPQLVRVKINNFSLYKQQPTFSYHFKPGINAILGINGIGKTTLIETILYSIVGFRLKKNEVKKTGQVKLTKENSDYFLDRCDPQSDNSKASVLLEYVIKRKKIVIERSLIEDKILTFKIDGQNKSTEEDSYNNCLVDLMGVTDFISAQKIIREFLIFDEQRLNVAWEVQTQDDILKILLLDEEAQIKIANLERQVSGLDTKGRHKSEDRRIIRDRIVILKEERQKISKNLDEVLINTTEQADVDVNADELITLKNTLNSEIESYRDNLEVLNSTLDGINAERDNLLGERNSASQTLEQIISKENQIETKMYKSIYERFPDYYFTLEKNLINLGECLTCGSKDKLLKDKFFKRKADRCCVICGSKINDKVDFDENDIQLLNDLYERKTSIIQFIENKNNNISKHNAKISEINKDIKILTENNTKKENYLVEVESRLSAVSDSLNPKDTYELMIRNLDENADILTKEINEIYLMREEAKTNLESVQRKFVEHLSSLNSKISYYFNKYASTFLGVQCELTIKQQTIRFIPHIKFMPKIAGYERGSIYSVSESQRFFLDQAFRMAIIEFLTEEVEDFKTFFITETPEGSLDLAYEEQVAKMFKVFAESNNNIIFTSNLNSSNFLHQVFEGIPDKDARILNMLEIGNLTKIQNNYYQLFKQKLTEIE